MSLDIGKVLKGGGLPYGDNNWTKLMDSFFQNIPPRLENYGKDITYSIPTLNTSQTPQLRFAVLEQAIPWPIVHSFV